MVLLIVRALLRRPSLSSTPTVTFCSVHIHNVVAKKRGRFHRASPIPSLQNAGVQGRFHRWRFQHERLLHSQRCPSLIPEFFSPWSFLPVGDSVPWTSSIASVLVSSSCPSAQMNSVWFHMAAIKLTMQRLALDPGINLLTSLCFSTFGNTNLPGPSSIMRSGASTTKKL